jgi:hypothetical protein
VAQHCSPEIKRAQTARAWYFGGFAIMSTNVPITVAHGNGIGPEITEAPLHIIQEAGAQIDVETIEIGEKVYPCGNSSGIEPGSWESLRRAKVFQPTMIDNLSVKVWPDGISETLLTDAYRCRFTATSGGATSRETVALSGRVLEQGLEIVRTETLPTYNGTVGYTLSQGQ